MRSILEKAIVHLLNEENEQAQALFHKFMVERARQIHESLRSGEDALLESFDDTSSDEMFEEGDLTGLEDSSESSDDSAADFGGESDDSAPAFGGEDDAAPADADSSDDEFGGETAGDDLSVGGEEEGSTEDRLADLEDQLTSLQQEFDALMGGEGSDMGDEAPSDEDTLGGEVDGALDSGETGDMAGSMEDDMAQGPVEEDDSDPFAGSGSGASQITSADPFAGGDSQSMTEGEGDEDEDEDDKDEDFDDITESVISELEKVMVSMTDGKEIGAGKSISQNKTSPALQKKPNPMADGKPITIKAEEHHGFERETAPSSKDMKKRQNTKSKAADGQSKVSKEGDKSALINKTPGAESNTKSPLAKR